MASTVTLLELRTQVRERADMVGSNFVSDSELTGYINASITELYDLLVLNYGEDYFTNPTPINVAVVAGTDTYALATSVYKIAGVDVLVNGFWGSVRKYAMGNRNRGQSASDLKDVRYRLIGNSLRFTPSPTADHSVRIWEVSKPTKLVDDADTFDGIAGWEEFVIVDAAIKCLAKEESDTSDLVRAKATQTARIERVSAQRDIGEPEEITDIYEENTEEYNLLGTW